MRTCVRVVRSGLSIALAPTPKQERKLASHAGAARFAYNFALALVRERLDLRAAGVKVDVPWTLPALRREWNRSKERVAPWWAANSKEAASSGLADLACGFKAFWECKRGQRAGARVGFPRFKRRGRVRESFRYTTGRFGVSDRTRLRLPRIGHVRTHEPTTKLLEKINAGRVRILSMTVSRESGRWYCSLCCEVERDDRPTARTASPVGVDVGVRHLAVLSTGERIANPRAFKQVQRRLRRFQRKLDRQRRQSNPGCFDERGRALRGGRSRQLLAASARNAAARAVVARAGVQPTPRRDPQTHQPARGRVSGRRGRALERSRPMPLGHRWAQTRPARRGARGDPPPACLQNGVAPRNADPSAHVLSVFEDLFGVRDGESQAAPVRADIPLRAVRTHPRSRRERRPQSRSIGTARRREWRGDRKRAVANSGKTRFYRAQG